jgi:hypothetical protein
MTLTGFVISAREVEDSFSASVFESVGILVLDASHGSSVLTAQKVASSVIFIPQRQLFRGQFGSFRKPGP